MNVQSELQDAKTEAFTEVVEHVRTLLADGTPGIYDVIAREVERSLMEAAKIHDLEDVEGKRPGFARHQLEELN